MQVAKWGNSLAVRLPAAVVEALELKEGDDIEIHVADARSFGVSRASPGGTNCCAVCAPSVAACPPTSSSTGRRRMPGSFFDTNIVLYAVSRDPAKAQRAETLIAAGGSISVQVLNEFANVARRKMGASWAETRALLAAIRGLLTVHPLTIAVHETGTGFGRALRPVDLR